MEKSLFCPAPYLRKIILFVLNIDLFTYISFNIPQVCILVFLWRRNYIWMSHSESVDWDENIYSQNLNPINTDYIELCLIIYEQICVCDAYYFSIFHLDNKCCSSRKFVLVVCQHLFKGPFKNYIIPKGDREV